MYHNTIASACTCSVYSCSSGVITAQFCQHTSSSFGPHCGTSQMRPIVTDRVVWSFSQSVCQSVTHSVSNDVSRAKTAELINLPFGCGLGWAQGSMY